MKALFVRWMLAFAVEAIAAAVASKVQLSNMPGVISTEARILAGQDVFAAPGVVLTTLYNRILFPFFFVQTMRLLPSLDPGHIFVAMRFASFLLCFGLMFQAIDRRAGRAGIDPQMAALATGLAFIATLLHHPGPTTSDIFDLALMFFIFLSIIEDRLGIAFALACLSAVNRESGAFAGVAYFILRAGHESPVRLLATSAVLAVIPYGLAIGVRRLVYQGNMPSMDAGQFFTGIPSNLATLMVDFMRANPNNNAYVLIAMTTLAVLPFARRSVSFDFRVRVLAATLSIAVASLMFGLVRELRIFLPCVSLLVAAAVADIAPSRRERAIGKA